MKTRLLMVMTAMISMTASAESLIFNTQQLSGGPGITPGSAWSFTISLSNVTNGVDPDEACNGCKLNVTTGNVSYNTATQLYTFGAGTLSVSMLAGGSLSTPYGGTISGAHALVALGDVGSFTMHYNGPNIGQVIVPITVAPTASNSYLYNTLLTAFGLPNGPANVPYSGLLSIYNLQNIVGFNAGTGAFTSAKYQGAQLELDAAPEPTAWLLLTFGLAVTAILRFRNRHA